MEFTCSASRTSRLLLVQVAALFIASSPAPFALVSGSTTDTPPVSTAGKSATTAATVMSTAASSTAEPSDKTSGNSTITTLPSTTTSEVFNETSSTSVAGSESTGVTTPVTTSTSMTSSGIRDFTNVTTTASTSSDSSAVPASSSMATTSNKSLESTTQPISSSATPNITTATITTTSSASQSKETSSNTTTVGTDYSTQNYTATTPSTPSTPSSATSQGTSTSTTFHSTSTEKPPPSTFTPGSSTTPAIQNPETAPGTNDGVIAAVVVIIIAIAIAVALFVVVWLRRHQRCQWNGTRGHKRRPAPRKRIKMKYFTSYVDLLHKDSGLIFQEQFEEIQLSTPKSYTYEAALKDENKIKNRYVNIIPYDHTRVKLSADTEAGGSDFINASYIPGYSSPREYIATQGPMTSTADDFWRMIWEQKSGIIVMLSDLQEKGRRKVDRYWPEEASSPEQFGDVAVELNSVSTHTCYTVRHFKLRMEKQEERMVLQFFIPGWEDHGANLSPDDIINFVQAVRMEAHTREGPVTVHCSAGVGRTGTFIALDFLMQFVSDNDLEAEVDVYNLVLNMRHNRPSMVQSEKQYVFIHDVLKIIIERKIKRLQGSNGVCESSSAVTNPAFDTVHTPDADELNCDSSQMLFTSSL